MLGEVPEILHIKENFYSQKFTNVAVVMKIIYTFGLNLTLPYTIWSSWMCGV